MPCSRTCPRRVKNRSLLLLSSLGHLSLSLSFFRSNNHLQTSSTHLHSPSTPSPLLPPSLSSPPTLHIPPFPPHTASVITLVGSDKCLGEVGGAESSEGNRGQGYREIVNFCSSVWKTFSTKSEPVTVTYQNL